MYFLAVLEPGRSKPKGLFFFAWDLVLIWRQQPSLCAHRAFPVRMLLGVCSLSRTLVTLDQCPPCNLIWPYLSFERLCLKMVVFRGIRAPVWDTGRVGTAGSQTVAILYFSRLPLFVSCIRLGVGWQDDVQMGLLGTSVVLHSKQLLSICWIWFQLNQFPNNLV